jgi:anti-sigma-K factor RskA
VNNCDQFREQIEAYALGALDIDERTGLDAHLASGCVNCTKAVEEERWLVTQLAYLAPDQAPPLLLKERLMRTVRADAAASRRSVLVFRSWSMWAWIGVAALIIFALYSGWGARRSRDQAHQAKNDAAEAQQDRQRLQEQLTLAQREVDILTDPASVKITLRPQNPQIPALDCAWHSELGIVVTGQHIGAPSGNHVLQLWLIPKTVGATPVPSLTKRPGVDGKFVLAVFSPPKVMADTKALAITEEPAGGSLQPTSAPIWVGGVS